MRRHSRRVLRTVKARAMANAFRYPYDRVMITGLRSGGNYAGRVIAISPQGESMP